VAARAHGAVRGGRRDDGLTLPPAANGWLAGKTGAAATTQPQETPMAVIVPFDLSYEFEVKASAADVFAVLADVPTSASHFPKVDKLVDMGDNTYRWELQRVGTAQVGIQTIYASKYVSDKKKGSVVWTPVKGVGNGQIGGSWAITDKKKSTHVVLNIKGEITVPLPGLMKMIVVPVVTNENEKLVEKYIANLIKRFGGEV
jgi:carbon monoxide dehydrogenase subunit G